MGVAVLAAIVVLGTAGYVMLGLELLDAVYMTVVTISTVGFEEVVELDRVGRIYTIGLILVGVGTTLYTFTVLLETLVEGRLNDMFGRRRMEREISALRGHVVVCGMGRVGRATVEAVGRMGMDYVMVDLDGERLAGLTGLTVHGDATEDAVLRAAGVDRAAVLVAALNHDADNLFTTLTARSLAPDVHIVARARQDNAEVRLRQAGADRIVNPQRIGGDRMAAFALQPNVAEFLDVVMHDDALEFRLEEFRVDPESALAGATLRDAQIRDHTGAMVLALREPDGRFRTNPQPDTLIEPRQVLIAIGTAEQLDALGRAAAARV